MNHLFNGPLTGKWIRFVPPPGLAVRLGQVGQYRPGHMVIAVEGQKPEWFACASIAVREVLDAPPTPPAVEKVEDAMTPPPAPPVAEPPAVPVAPVGELPPPGVPAAPPVPEPPALPGLAGPTSAPKSSVHARLRQANASSRTAADHGTAAATEADFVQGVEETRKPRIVTS
jgi:hypothetical protein